MSYVVVAQWKARDREAETIEGILRELAPAARREPGNLQFTVHRSTTDRNDFLLYEVYTSEQAFGDHQQTQHFKTLVLERALPLLANRVRNAYLIVVP